MMEFELRISGVECNRSTNWATTTALRIGHNKYLSHNSKWSGYRFGSWCLTRFFTVGVAASDPRSWLNLTPVNASSVKPRTSQVPGQLGHLDGLVVSMLSSRLGRHGLNPAKMPELQIWNPSTQQDSMARPLAVLQLLPWLSQDSRGRVVDPSCHKCSLTFSINWVKSLLAKGEERFSRTEKLVWWVKKSQRSSG